MFEKFVEVNARHVCLVTNNRSVVEQYNVTTPFIGCLKNITHLTWHGQTYSFFSIITGDKLVGLSSQIESDTAHHWWDIF